jgi:hypothetical protein
MEDGLHVVPVRVEGVGGVVVGVVALADPGRAIVAPAVGESGGVELVDRLGIGGSEGEVLSTSASNSSRSLGKLPGGNASRGNVPPPTQL